MNNNDVRRAEARIVTWLRTYEVNSVNLLGKLSCSYEDAPLHAEDIAVLVKALNVREAQLTERPVVRIPQMADKMRLELVLALLKSYPKATAEQIGDLAADLFRITDEFVEKMKEPSGE